MILVIDEEEELGSTVACANKRNNSSARFASVCKPFHTIGALSV